MSLTISGMRASSLAFLLLVIPVGALSQFNPPAQGGLSPTLKARSDFARLQAGEKADRKTALYELHRHGKEAIPLLIDSLDSAEPFEQIALVDPISSYIPPDSLRRSYKGVLYAYAIELILGKASLRGDPKHSEFLVDHEDCIYRYGLLKRDGEMLRPEDLRLLKSTYRAWWEKYKDLPLEQLRQLWAENNRPLKNSIFKWL